MTEENAKLFNALSNKNQKLILKLCSDELINKVIVQAKKETAQMFAELINNHFSADDEYDYPTLTAGDVERIRDLCISNMYI